MYLGLMKRWIGTRKEGYGMQLIALERGSRADTLGCFPFFVIRVSWICC